MKKELKWFVNKKRLNEYNQSYAESRIEKILRTNCINFKKEVSFDECRSPKGNLLIFDFVLPDFDLFIEYDGIQHTTNSELCYNDSIKTKFIKATKYRLVRLNSNNWGTLEKDIMSIVSKSKYKKHSKQNKQKEAIKKPDNKKVFINLMSRAQKKKVSISKLPVTINDYNSFYNSK